MLITDMALEEIVDQIASHRPERGGALYGPRSYPLVTHFDFDADAVTTHASYIPSVRLVERVRKVERETGLKFKGIVHSHPRGLIRPSNGDRDSAANLFHHNSHLASLAMPIVQQVRERSARSVKGCIHWYSAERRSGGRAHGSDGPLLPGSRTGHPAVEILDEDFHVLPIHEHCVTVLEHLRKLGFVLALEGCLQPLQIEHVQLIGLVARSREGHEFLYFVSFDYPVVAPVVLYAFDGDTKGLKLDWDGLGDVEASLKRVSNLLANEWGRGPSTDPDVAKPQSTPFFRGLREV
jgi:proteasome lid subunit RPN8/RPN11